jgi:hypothetical protein
MALLTALARETDLPPLLQDYDMKRAAQYANVVGALVATNIGAQSAKISHQDILERAEERYGKQVALPQKPVSPAKAATPPIIAKPSSNPEPVKSQAMPEPLLIEPPSLSKPEVVKEAPAKETPVKKTRVKAKA